VCQCDCPRMHVDQAGPVGQVAAALAWDRLEWLERRNGWRPDMPGLAQFLAILSARVTATPVETNLAVGTSRPSQLSFGI
jgi:hypothetical protein